MSRWGDEKTLFFISCYRDHECLWNPTSFFYKSKAARADAYASLLEQFNDGNLTVQLLKTKIKNVRTTYHQELNKIRYSLQSGSAVYKPTLSWFDALDAFLGETIQKESTKTIPQASRKFSNFKRKLCSSSHTDFNASAQTWSTDKAEYTLEVQPLTNDQEASGRTKVRPLTNKLMTVQGDETDSEKSRTNRLDLSTTSTVRNTASLCEDEFHFFGMNVAAQLRSLPLHTALQLQSEFQNTLYLARVQSYLPGPDMEETTTQLVEDSESESVEQDLDEKDFPIDIQDTIELPIESPLSRETKVNESVFKKAWDAS